MFILVSICSLIRQINETERNHKLQCVLTKNRTHSFIRSLMKLQVVNNSDFLSINGIKVCRPKICYCTAVLGWQHTMYSALYSVQFVA